MTLPIGTKLGPYEVLAPLGAGGMGEVYRARDPRLNREVAIKVLPTSLSADPDRLRRFEQEAKAAGVLNHPNITIVYDFGTHEEAPYVVQELLEGETLRAELSGGRFSPRKAIDYALQITQGLAAAHDKGIVHRDLKPENLFVTKEGRVKILDFGLAKLTQSDAGGSSATNLPTQTRGTEPGVVLGTLGYMSPEQIKAKPADARSDIFAFGAIFYEMLSGQRAFHADSAGETMAAILKEDPPDLSLTNANIGPGLERIVRHCLEKNPERRFQSASDIAFAVESLSGLPSASGAAQVSPTVHPRRSRAAAAVTAALALLAAALLAGSWLRGGGDRSFPTYERLTYRRGFISNARFAPDGQTILYSADWDGEPSRIFSTRPDGKDSTMLPLPSALLLSVSSRGEMAILLDPKADYNLYFRSGTLALVPLSGGSPREVLRQVTLADWGPDGKDLAVVRQAGGRQRLEYPPGQLLYESQAWIVSPRVSPSGDQVSFYEGLPFNGYSHVIVDRRGRKTVLGPVMPDFWASDWAPGGEEIWFPSTADGESTPFMATDLSGRRRMLERAPMTGDLNDVSEDGRALMTVYNWEESTFGLLPGRATDSRILSRTDLRLTDISADGKLLALREVLLRSKQGVWIARGDGSPPIRLGDGVAHGLSQDGAWVLASQQGLLMALPTGVGEPRAVSEGFFETIRWAGWFRDGQRVVVSGQQRGGKSGIFVVGPNEKEPRRVAPEGFDLAFAGNAVSPDGLLIAARSPEDRMVLCPVDGGGSPRPIPGLVGRYQPIQWTADGRGLFVFRLGDMPARVEQIDVESGRATLWKELAPPDSAGAILRTIAMTPDAKAYAYSSQQYLSTLYLVENLESWRRPTFWSRVFGRRSEAGEGP